MGLTNNKLKFYSLTNILSKNAQYNMVIGERSNGKTYASLKYGIEKYFKDDEQMAYVRRWAEDFKGKRGQVVFDALVSDGTIKKLSNNRWTDVYYYSGKWYFCRYDDRNVRITDNKPFCFGFALSNMEHDKSTSYPMITTVIFDEFISRQAYLGEDEFVIFCNVLSTIIRQRDNVKIFMLGNTVNKYCPYFKEMGMKNIETMNKGDIRVYEYGDSGLRVAVEYADSISKKGKPSDKYFAFDNPKLHMITGGSWEIDIYPHFPLELKHQPRNILFKYYMIFDEQILECEVIQISEQIFTYIHVKTSELKSEDTDLIYSTDYDVRYNWKRNICKPTNQLEKKIYDFFRNDKVFYQDNEIGEVVRNYLLWCGKNV